MNLLGISASLRNARFGAGSRGLIEQLENLENKEDLQQFLEAQTKIRFEEFVEAGRGKEEPFDEIYKRLRKLRGERGLSNSEAALAAAMWGAIQEGAEATHVSLASHFPVAGAGRNLDVLREQILAADVLLISGPVYFGDRGSLAQSFFELLLSDDTLAQACKGKLYAGIAVGAKRNGGQETTLIYQMLDMVNLGFLAVGNDSDTTAQYGGTGVAGDVGTFQKDDYGINTCIGTGRRAAKVADLLSLGRDPEVQLADPLKVQLWVLQDTQDKLGLGYFEKWAKAVSEKSDEPVEFEIIEFSDEEIVRCIACDVCPISVGPTEEYRCIITTAKDVFVQKHKKLIEADAVLLCAYSPEDKKRLTSVYQKFIERTRYLRRDNYALGDLLCAPFVISELSARQNLHLRMLTSGIRHHTVLHRPIIGMIHEGTLLTFDKIVETGLDFVKEAKSLTLGRYVKGHSTSQIYNPVGYEVSAAKAREDNLNGRTKAAINTSISNRSRNAKRRVTKT